MSTFWLKSLLCRDEELSPDLFLVTRDVRESRKRLGLDPDPLLEEIYHFLQSLYHRVESKEKEK